MSDASSGLQPAVFLDRDGTVIREKSYLTDPHGVELIPGTVAALRDLRDAGIPFVIVTNQSGIARGRVTEDQYHSVAARLQSLLEEAGVPPAATRYCPHHPSVTGPCDCRKPEPGMYLDAADALGLDLTRSYYVGDKISDVAPAATFTGRGILVRTGYGKDFEAEVHPEVVVVDDLPAAVRWILGEHAAGGLRGVDPP